MELKSLFQDDEAVSPVIGVILMVAITVILAAVIGAFVLDIGGGQEAAPQANFDWSYENSGGSTQVSVEHAGGGQVDASQLSLGDNFNSCSITTSTDTLSAGDNVLDSDSCGVSGSSGDSLQIVWTSSDGGQTQVISEGEIP